MSLGVYLGTDVEVPGFGEVRIGDIGLDPGEARRPVALGQKAHVARIAERLGNGWNGSCIFLDRAVPWEDPDAADDPEAERRRAAWAGLRRIAEAALLLDPEAMIFSCRDGDEGQRPQVERYLAPGDLDADRNPLETDGGSGETPPVLIHLRAGGGDG
jgi:hypothetical protein